MPISHVVLGISVSEAARKQVSCEIERKLRQPLRRRALAVRAFAEAALRLRFSEPAESGMQPAQLLACRRSEDVGDDLWHVYNRCQEHLLRGGLIRRLTSRATTRIRPSAGIGDRSADFLRAVTVRPAKAGASSGRQTHRGKSRSPVAWVAGSREIEILKPTDKCHRRMAASHSVVA